jgi:hypothetical protein
MAEQCIEHKGHKIVIKPDADPPEVYIDGKRVDISVSPAGYWTPHDAYRRFDKLEDLALAVASRRVLPE